MDGFFNSLIEHIFVEDLQYCVIDEADSLFLKDFGEEIMLFLKHVQVRFLVMKSVVVFM